MINQILIKVKLTLKVYAFSNSFLLLNSHHLFHRFSYVKMIQVHSEFAGFDLRIIQQILH